MIMGQKPVADGSIRRQVWLGLIGVAVLVATLSLRFEGRRWWCRLGDWSPISTGIKTPHTSQHLLDPYSLTHVLHGVVLYAGFWLVIRRVRWEARLAGAVMLEAGWEIIENSQTVIDRYRAGTIALGYDGDSVVNSLGDIGACALGFMLARTLPVRWSVGLFVAVEVGLLVVYRDNLLLNVIMLIHSFDSIRTWQASR